MPYRKGLWIAIAVVALALATIGAEAAVIEGRAAYRERIAMPPDAVFEARLEDTGRADAPAAVLGRHRIENAGNPPYRFRIEVDDALLQPGGRYAVRATLTVRDRLMFTTDTAVPFVPGEAAQPLELRLVSARGGAGPGAGATAGRPGRLPASFVGDLPAASGGPVRLQVDLLPGHAFQLRRTFSGRPEPNRFDDIGRWRPDPARRGRLEFVGSRERLTFEWADGGAALRLLDAQGRRIDSASGHDDRLRRLDTAAPIEPQLALTGMLTYMADAASLVLCADGRRLPVALEADWRAAERAYLAARPAPGAPLLVSFDGRIAPRRVGEEGQPARPAVVVDRFSAAWPRETCGTPWAESPLRNTYWRLTRLNGEPVTVAAQQREPHLIFDAKESRVAGSSGCNRVLGGFEADGDRLTLGRLAGTMMACPDGMAQERAFLDALAKVAHWQVRGSHLELLDGQRQLLARFEAVALR